MSKGITFGDSKRDRDLIKRITDYQEKSGISTFVEAVRKLCDDALQLKKISKWQEKSSWKKHWASF